METLEKKYNIQDLRSKIMVKEEEAGALLSIARGTLKEMRLKGQAPPHLYKGKYAYYPVRALEKWAMDELVIKDV